MAGKRVIVHRTKIERKGTKEPARTGSVAPSDRKMAQKLNDTDTEIVVGPRTEKADVS